MTKKDAIKYLQQLYPNGGHCWLDEQRIEAIDMAIKALQEEPVSEELEEAANDYDNHFGALYVEDEEGDYVENLTARKNAFKAGANWQKVQFENNRLKHCNSITNEQAELEQVFIDQHLDKYQRMPTFLDAIEYGMKLQIEQMIEKACDSYCKVCKISNCRSNECKLISVFKQAMKDEVS